MCEQGFASDKATWSDVTEEEQRERDKELWLDEEIAPPFVEKMPSLPAARRSSASAKLMS
eukprot:7330861-Karenia_brevis.AAC.1